MFSILNGWLNLHILKFIVVIYHIRRMNFFD
ncbi:Uncharacterised protein [Klebsiella pneumoniae]|nr:Uncharacterised protein [Klebsiella pneumoniae]